MEKEAVDHPGLYISSLAGNWTLCFASSVAPISRVPKTMPMLLRERAEPQAAQHRDKHRTERRNPRTDQDLPPPQFWDNLSHIPLVKRALRELDRRNNTAQLREEDPEFWRPSPGDPRQLGAGINHRDIRRFSRTGGPDLIDLRGVCCCICSFAHLVPSQYISCAHIVPIMCL